MEKEELLQYFCCVKCISVSDPCLGVSTRFAQFSGARGPPFYPPSWKETVNFCGVNQRQDCTFGSLNFFHARNSTIPHSPIPAVHIGAWPSLAILLPKQSLPPIVQLQDRNR